MATSSTHRTATVASRLARHPGGIAAAGKGVVP
jgi:hypothetical protein